MGLLITINFFFINLLLFNYKQNKIIKVKYKNNNSFFNLNRLIIIFFKRNNVIKSDVLYIIIFIQYNREYYFTLLMVITCIIGLFYSSYIVIYSYKNTVKWYKKYGKILLIIKYNNYLIQSFFHQKIDSNIIGIKSINYNLINKNYSNVFCINNIQNSIYYALNCFLVINTLKERAFLYKIKNFFNNKVYFCKIYKNGI